MEELLVRYKLLGVPQRMAIVLAVSALLFWFLSTADKLAGPKSQLKAAEESYKGKQAELDKMVTSYDNAATKEELENQKRQLERQIQQRIGSNSAMLPEKFHLDKMMDTVAQLAKHHNVKLISFDMQDERERGSEYRYYELPIKLEISGSYGSCGHFYGDLIRLDTLVQMRDIKMNHVLQSLEQRNSFNDGFANSSSPQSTDVVANLIASLQKYMVKSEATMVIFRAS